MKKLSNVLVLSVVYLGLASAASQDANAARFTLLGGINLPQADVAGATFDMSYQGGLLLELMASQKVGFELGGLFHTRKVTVLSASTTTQDVQLPAVLHVWIGNHFALGAGGYYGLSLESGGSADYGALGNARISLGGGATRFIIDGRYNYGLKDHGGLKYQEIAIMAGITFGAKGK